MIADPMIVGTNIGFECIVFGHTPDKQQHFTLLPGIESTFVTRLIVPFVTRKGRRVYNQIFIDSSIYWGSYDFHERL